MPATKPSGLDWRWPDGLLIDLNNNGTHLLQVNYQYELDRLHDNNRAYLVDSRVPAAPAVEALLGPHG